MRPYHEVPWIDLRKRRAEQLAAMVMNQIGTFLRDDDQVNGPKYASRKLLEFFHTLGVEVITDFERTQAGLPLRDQQGYTPEELHRLEAARAAAMFNPPNILVGKDGPLNVKPVAPDAAQR